MSLQPLEYFCKIVDQYCLYFCSSVFIIKRSERDSNPCGVAAKRFSRPPRYDRFDIAPNILLKIISSEIMLCVSCFRISPQRKNYINKGVLSCQPYFSIFFLIFFTLRQIEFFYCIKLSDFSEQFAYLLVFTPVNMIGVFYTTQTRFL